MTETNSGHKAPTSVVYYDGYRTAKDVARELRTNGGLIQIGVVEAGNENRFAFGDNKFIVYALFYHAADQTIFDVIGNRSPTLRTFKDPSAIINLVYKISPGEPSVDIPFLHARNLIYPRNNPLHVRPPPRRKQIP